MSADPRLVEAIADALRPMRLVQELPNGFVDDQAAFARTIAESLSAAGLVWADNYDYEHIGFLNPSGALVSTPRVEALNKRLHTMVTQAEPCGHGCTHRLFGEWTALGLANVLGRAVSPQPEYEKVGWVTSEPGGGYFSVYVDRDLANYPAPGSPVFVRRGEG